MKKITLKHPIQINGEKKSCLNLRRVKVGDLEVMNYETSDIAKSICLLSMIAEITPDHVRSMDAADFAECSEVVADFLG